MNLRNPIARSAIKAAALAALILLAAGTQGVSADEPEITRQYPQEGDVLKERPTVLQMCFKDPVDVRDLPPLDEGDFRFALIPPGNSGGLEMRIVFQPDGYGVLLYPGNPVSELPDGEWTWEYRVVDRESGDAPEATVKFTTNAVEGEDILQPTPPACLAEGASNQPTATVAATDDDRPSETPGGVNKEDDDPGVLTLALITIGIAAAAAFVGMLAFLFRKRIGYEPHAPPGDSGETGDDNHH